MAIDWDSWDSVSFSLCHAQLTHQQLTLLSQLHTGVCNFLPYCTHFGPDKELCKCGKVESRKHVLLFCPLYAGPALPFP
jgi:hypothetical protein